MNDINPAIHLSSIDPAMPLTGQVFGPPMSIRKRRQENRRLRRLLAFYQQASIATIAFRRVEPPIPGTVGVDTTTDYSCRSFKTFAKEHRWCR